MNKEEQVIMGFRDLLNKMAWLNKSKMENILKEYKPSEVHCIKIKMLMLHNLQYLFI